MELAERLDVGSARTGDVETARRQVVTWFEAERGWREPSHLILDMNLPDRHGAVILRHVRAADLPIKVGVLSGTADETLLAEAGDLRPDAMFKKPPDWDALLGWVATP